MIAVDTNILIYSCDKSDLVRQEKALRFLDEAEDCVIPWQVACEFIAAARKLERQGFTAEAAWARLAEFLDAFPLVLPTPNVLIVASDPHLKRGWSFWDALIVAACTEGGISRLYSEDLPGQNPPEGLEIINPFL